MRPSAFIYTIHIRRTNPLPSHARRARPFLIWPRDANGRAGSTFTCFPWGIIRTRFVCECVCVYEPLRRVLEREKARGGGSHEDEGTEGRCSLGPTGVLVQDPAGVRERVGAMLGDGGRAASGASGGAVGRQQHHPKQPNNHLRFGFDSLRPLWKHVFRFISPPPCVFFLLLHTCLDRGLIDTGSLLQ